MQSRWKVKFSSYLSSAKPEFLPGSSAEVKLPRLSLVWPASHSASHLPLRVSATSLLQRRSSHCRRQFFPWGALSWLFNTSNCAGSPQHSSPVTVVLCCNCWRFTVEFRIYCATHKPTRMVFHRLHLWDNCSNSSLVAMVAVSTSLMTCASACVSLVALVTISDGHLSE